MANSLNKSYTKSLGLTKSAPSASSTLYNVSKEVKNLSTRMANTTDKYGAPIDVAKETDKRNVIEKVLNLPEGQNFLMDIVDIVNRPQEALFGALDNAFNGEDVLEGAWQGLSGNKETRGGDLIRSIFGEDDPLFTVGSLDVRASDLLGFYLDIKLDPMDIPLIHSDDVTRLVTKLDDTEVGKILTKAVKSSTKNKNLLEEAEGLMKKSDVIRDTVDGSSKLIQDVEGLRKSLDTLDETVLDSSTKASVGQILNSVSATEGSVIMKARAEAQHEIAELYKAKANMTFGQHINQMLGLYQKSDIKGKGLLSLEELTEEGKAVFTGIDRKLSLQELAFRTTLALPKSAVGLTDYSIDLFARMMDESRGRQVQELQEVVKEASEGLVDYAKTATMEEEAIEKAKSLAQGYEGIKRDIIDRFVPLSNIDPVTQKIINNDKSMARIAKEKAIPCLEEVNRLSDEIDSKGIAVTLKDGANYTIRGIDVVDAVVDGLKEMKLNAVDVAKDTSRLTRKIDLLEAIGVGQRNLCLTKGQFDPMINHLAEAIVNITGLPSDAKNIDEFINKYVVDIRELGDNAMKNISRTAGKSEVTIDKFFSFKSTLGEYLQMQGLAVSGKDGVLELTELATGNKELMKCMENLRAPVAVPAEKIELFNIIRTNPTLMDYANKMINQYDSMVSQIQYPLADTISQGYLRHNLSPAASRLTRLLKDNKYTPEKASLNTFLTKYSDFEQRKFIGSVTEINAIMNTEAKRFLDYRLSDLTKVDNASMLKNPKEVQNMINQLNEFKDLIKEGKFNWFEENLQKNFSDYIDDIPTSIMKFKMNQHIVAGIIFQDFLFEYNNKEAVAKLTSLNSELSLINDKRAKLVKMLNERNLSNATSYDDLLKAVADDASEVIKTSDISALDNKNSTSRVLKNLNNISKDSAKFEQNVDYVINTLNTCKSLNLSKLDNLSSDINSIAYSNIVAKNKKIDSLISEFNSLKVLNNDTHFENVNSIVKNCSEEIEKLNADIEALNDKTNGLADYYAKIKQKRLIETRTSSSSAFKYDTTVYNAYDVNQFCAQIEKSCGKLSKEGALPVTNQPITEANDIINSVLKSIKSSAGENGTVLVDKRIARFLDVKINAQDTQGLMKYVKQVTNTFKSNVLLRLGFNVRNYFGIMSNLYLSGMGIREANKRFLESHKIFSKYNGIEKKLADAEPTILELAQKLNKNVLNSVDDMEAYAKPILDNINMVAHDGSKVDFTDLLTAIAKSGAEATTDTSSIVRTFIASKILTAEDYNIFQTVNEFYACGFSSPQPLKQAVRYGLSNSSQWSFDYQEYLTEAQKTYRDTLLKQGETPTNAYRKAKEFFDKIKVCNMWGNEVVDSYGRMAVFMKARDAKTGADYLRTLGVTTADEAVRLAMFDPFDMSSFEKDYMRTIFPFYSFAKKNLEYQLVNSINNSKQYYHMFKALKLLYHYEGIDINESNQYKLEKSYIPIPVIGNKNSDKYYLLKASLPASDLGDILSIKGASSYLLSALNPVIKAPIELTTNQNIFTGMSISNYEKEPSKRFAFDSPEFLQALDIDNNGKIGLTKKTEYIMNNLVPWTAGFNTPTSFAYDIAEAVTDVLMNPDDPETAPIAKLLVGSGLVANGSKEKDEYSYQYNELEKLQDAVKRYKAQGIKMTTMAELQSRNSSTWGSYINKLTK